MMTFTQRISHLWENCKSLEEWKEACEWIASVTISKVNTSRAVENAFIEKYGEEAFEKMLDEIIEIDDEMEEEMDESSILTEYGYTKRDVRIVPPMFAAKIMNGGYDIYLLYPGNKKEKAKNIKEIESFDGLLGMLPADMDRMIEEQRSLEN